MPALLPRHLVGALALACLASSSPSIAAALPSATDRPILVIGASFADGRLPFNDSLQAPFGGLAVGFGSYLSLGDALVHQGLLVVNEAQAGATTFARDTCFADACIPVGWQGYSTQLAKALARVTIRNPADPNQVLGYNAGYVYISLANDCVHSGAAGIPQNAALPCNQAEVDAFVDRMIDVGEDAMDLGLVPIYSHYPDYDDLDLSIQQVATGLTWVADESQWNMLATTFATRVADELPGAILVDAWHNMQTIGDGLHPTPKSANKAAKRIRDAIAEYEACQ